MSIEKYIKTATPEMQSHIPNSLINLSFILSDINGLVADVNAKYVTSSLQILPTGVISSSILITVDPYGDILGSDVFDNRLSTRGSMVYYALSKSDPSLVCRDSSTTLSPLFVNDIPSNISTLMAYLYVEGLALYNSCMSYREGDTFAMTMDEIARVLNNTSVISTEVEALGNGHSVYTLLNVVRHLQRSILFIKYNLSKILR